MLDHIFSSTVSGPSSWSSGGRGASVGIGHPGAATDSAASAGAGGWAVAGHALRNARGSQGWAREGPGSGLQNPTWHLAHYGKWWKHLSSMDFHGFPTFLFCWIARFIAFFSPRLCEGFLFLVVHFRPASRPAPAPLPPASRTQLTHAQLVKHNLSTHNLLTHNLTTHNLTTHNMSSHNLLTHTTCPNTTCPHTTCHHTTCTHTQLVTHNLSNTTCPHTHNLLTQTWPHTTWPHRTCPHTTCSHTTCPHTTCPHTTCHHTTCSHTTCHHTTCHHNLLTHNLSTHNLLTHNLSTHNLSPDNLLSHTQLVHTQLVLTQVVTTQLAHTQLVTFTLRGRRGAWRHQPALCVAGVALGDICLLFAWQAWHLVTWTCTLRGKRGTYGTGLALVARGTYGTGLALVARLVPSWRRCRRGCWRGRRGRRGTWRHGLSVCVAGVALGDIDRHFAWQAWNL